MNTLRALALFLVLALFALVPLAFSTPAARAADPVIVRVTTSGTTTWPCGDRIDWSNPCPLQTALNFAPSGSELWVAAGTYKPTTFADRTMTFLLRSGIALYGGFAGGETLRSQRNFTAHVTILSGDIGVQGNSGDNSYHVVTASGVTNTAVLDGFTVTGGNGLPGGGMHNYYGSPMVTNVTFSGNSATSGGGMSSFYSSPTLTNVTLSGNTASNYGGGMYNVDSTPILSNVTFSGNSANIGGGMASENHSSPTLTNVTFSGNTATDLGGGMYNDTSSPTLTNVTFSGNTASNYGGGMYNMCLQSPTIRNSILWGNTALNGSQIYNDPICYPTLFYVVVQGGYPSGTNIITTDPHLGALGNYGSSTQTVPVMPGSSAINAGENSTCAPNDQRGKPRVGTCDIGAFEFQGISLTKARGDNQFAPPSSPFATPLEVALTETGSPLPFPGETITFTAPASGASAAWSGSLTQAATTNSSGVATVDPPTANGILGSYGVTAHTAAATAPVMFTLTNALGHYLPLIRK